MIIGRFGLVVASILAAGPAVAQPAVVFDKEWEAVFARTDGWTGGDVAATVDLQDGRILWLFGDSLIGPATDGKRAAETRMVNNAIAVHPLDRRAPWRAPAATAVQFYWGRNDGKGRPTAWIAPSQPSGDWFWPTGGGIAFRSGNRTRLLLFLFRVRRDPQGKGVWNFQTAGTTLAVVDDVRAPVAEWKPRLLDIPHSTASTGVRLKTETLWGMAACRAPRQNADEPLELLIFGTRRGGLAVSDLLVARVGSDSVEQMNAWRFWAGDPPAVGWTADAKRARGVADRIVSEFSIEPRIQNAQAHWLLIQSELLLGRRILGRAARRPQGPWSAPAELLAVPDVGRSRQYFTYAAKGHFLISRPGEVLVTYLVNSNNFADLFNDASIYRPRFVRVALKGIADP